MKVPQKNRQTGQKLEDHAMGEEHRDIGEALAFWLSLCAGLLLFGLAVIGFFQIEAQPIEALTILLEPLGMGPNLDQAFHIVMGILGAWLTLGFYTRAAATLALGLILTKVLFIKGVIALSVTIVVCAMVATIVAIKTAR